jgi:von Willebrand factor type A domain
MTTLPGCRHLLVLMLAVSLTALGRPARAFDSFVGTRTETLSERAHGAVLTVMRDHAELVVRRTIWNAGKLSDQATFELELPAGAVATRLRTRGTGPAAPWFEGELLEAEEAAARYHALTGFGGHYPKDPALLSWQSQGHLTLQVFPCPPHSKKVVEYTLELPYTYANGARHWELPALGTPETPGRVQLVSQGAHDELRVDGKLFASGGLLPSPGDKPLDIALSTPSASLEAELVSVPLVSGRVLTRYALRAAPQLSKLPKQAYVVLVIDASRSTESDFEQAAKSSLDAYLSNLPDAHVEVMTFDRVVKHQLGGFGTTAAARYALQVLSLGRLNGSDVDRALFEADQLLTAAPAGAPRRIVLVTDGLTRSTLTPERLRGAVAHSHALVHVGLLEGGAPEVSRVDEHAWSETIRSTGGLLWRASAPSQPNKTQELRQASVAVYEEWARPLRIDRIGGFADNFSLVDDLQVTSLAEGEGHERLYIDTTPTGSLSVTGELWSTPVKVLANRDETQGDLWSALVFGSLALNELSEPEMMTLALRGRAVSPVTSYLAIEPGVRPSTEGLKPEDFLNQGWGAAPRLRMGGCKLSGRAQPLDLQAFLDQRLRPEYEHCGGTLGESYVDLETTRSEIVRVELSAMDGPPDSLTSSCFSEAVWALQLPEAFAEDWATFRVEL